MGKLLIHHRAPASSFPSSTGKFATLETAKQAAFHFNPHSIFHPSRRDCRWCASPTTDDPTHYRINKTSLPSSQWQFQITIYY